MRPQRFPGFAAILMLTSAVLAGLELLFLRAPGLQANEVRATVADREGNPVYCLFRLDAK